MQKGLSPCYDGNWNKTNQEEESPMEKYIIDSVTLKEIEWELFRALQRAFADLFRQVLEEIDQRLAEQRDKRRYALKAKRSITMQTMFGEVEITRNYYFDREKQRYTSLLDGFL